MTTQALQVLDYTVPLGQRLGVLHRMSLAQVPVEMPLFLVNGARPGPRLTVTAGVHGAEYASIEAALRLGRTLDPATLSGQVVIAPIVNPLAFSARSIYVTPVDGKNLNRQFPGRAGGTFSQALAHWLYESLLRPSDAYIDLHGGDLVEALEPFSIIASTGDDAVDRASLDLANAFGIHYVLRGETPGSTYQAAARAGVPAVLAEAGGQGIWAEENVNLLANGVRRVMHHLGMVSTQPEAPQEAPVLLKRWSWLRAEHDGLFYPRVQVGQQVTEGQDLGAVTDVFGDPMQPVTAPISGVVLFLVTSLAMNQGDPLLAIAA